VQHFASIAQKHIGTPLASVTVLARFLNRVDWYVS